jgi:general secretion pathway protein G
MRRSGKSQCNRACHTTAGFTLIELLTVIAIIGILAALTFPAISKIRTRGRIAAVKEQLRQIETALEAYYAEWDTYPPLGNDWLGGGFFPSEDVGLDGKGPFVYSGGQWVVNGAYTGPDRDGTEGNYAFDGPRNGPEDKGIMPWLGANDPTKGNERLDGTYYDRLGMFADADKQGLIDEFASATYYHYYPGYVYGKTQTGMPKYKGYAGWNDYKSNHPTFYNRWVIYSVGLDGNDHALHNYYLVMQDGEDVGADAFASDVTDDGSGTPNSTSDNDGILFEPSVGENNGTNDNFATGNVRETRWDTPSTGSERGAPGGNMAVLEGPRGEPVFNYDVRMERRREKAVYITPDGDKVAFGPIMRYGP